MPLPQRTEPPKEPLAPLGRKRAGTRPAVVQGGVGDTYSHLMDGIGSDAVTGRFWGRKANLLASVLRDMVAELY